MFTLQKGSDFNIFEDYVFADYQGFWHKKDNIKRIKIKIRMALCLIAAQSYDIKTYDATDISHHPYCVPIFCNIQNDKFRKIFQNKGWNDAIDIMNGLRILNQMHIEQQLHKMKNATIKELEPIYDVSLSFGLLFFCLLALLFFFKVLPERFSFPPIANHVNTLKNKQTAYYHKLYSKYKMCQSRDIIFQMANGDTLQNWIHESGTFQIEVQSPTELAVKQVYVCMCNIFKRHF